MSARAVASDSVRPERSALDAVLALSDDLGVLSIYVDADPALWAGPRPAWQAPVRIGLRRVLEQARQDWPRAERLALEARLDELRPELALLLDPRARGRGRALFAGIVNGGLERVELRAPFAPSVTFDRHARVLPLLSTLQAGRAAGVVCATRARMDVYEWADGATAALETLDLAPQEDAVRGRPGATNPAVRQPAPERDRFAAATQARVLARLRWAVRQLERAAAERRWDAIVIDGDPRLVREIETSFRLDGIALVPSKQPLIGIGAVDAALRAGVTLRKIRAARARELVEQLRTSPLATRGSVAVATALAHGRVERLLLNTSLTDSARAEELLRRADATDAEVVLLDPPARELGGDGTAALLRW